MDRASDRARRRLATYHFPAESTGAGMLHATPACRPVRNRSALATRSARCTQRNGLLANHSARAANHRGINHTGGRYPNTGDDNGAAPPYFGYTLMRNEAQRMLADIQELAPGLASRA